MTDSTPATEATQPLPPSWPQALADWQRSAEQMRAGGGPKAQQRQHDKNRLTARERIRQLVDGGSEFDELMTFAGWGMYEEVGGCPSGGTSRRRCRTCGGCGACAGDSGCDRSR